MRRRPATHFDPPLAALGIAALGLALGAPAPAAAQAGGYTAWSYKAQVEDLSTPETLRMFEASGTGTEHFQTEVDTGPNGTLNLSAMPSVASGGGAPQLKSMASVVQFSTHAGRGVRAIAQARAGLVDTFTVTAAPDFSGGYLNFVWGLDGNMWANLISNSSESPHLRFVGWEFYQQAELSVSGAGLPRSTVGKFSWSSTSSPVTDEMAAFEDHLAWGPDRGPLLFEDEDRILIQEQVGGGGAQSIAVALQAGAPVTLQFELFTGVNMGVFNVDNGEIFVADHGMDFAQTATLQGVQLLNADNTPYAGEWSLASAEGIGYTLLPVPEPGTWALWLAGLGALAGVGLRRRRGDVNAGR